MSGVPHASRIFFYYTVRTHPNNTMSASSKTEGLSSALIDIGGDPFDTAELIRIASARNRGCLLAPYLAMDCHLTC